MSLIIVPGRPAPYRLDKQQEVYVKVIAESRRLIEQMTDLYEKCDRLRNRIKFLAHALKQQVEFTRYLSDRLSHAEAGYAMLSHECRSAIGQLQAAKQAVYDSPNQAAMRERDMWKHEFNLLANIVCKKIEEIADLRAGLQQASERANQSHRAAEKARIAVHAMNGGITSLLNWVQKVKS